MALVNVKCTNCGGTLQVDDSREAEICPYCGSAFVVEKAVQNFNVINNISAEVVHIYGKTESDFIIEGNVLLEYKGNATKVHIPDMVHEIGRDAFRGKKYITSITFPKNLECIGVGAFYGCERLEEVVLPEGVDAVADAAFANCCALQRVMLPLSVQKIGNFAFIGCNALADFQWSDNVQMVGMMAFYGLQSLKKITIPRKLTCWFAAAFDKCTNLKEVYFNGSSDELIRLFTYLRFRPRQGDPSKAHIESLCNEYSIRPFDEPGSYFAEVYFNPEPSAINSLDAIYCNGDMLEGALQVPNDIDSIIFATHFNLLFGYKRISCIEYKKGDSVKFCPVCRNYKSISKFGMCKVCGTKYVAVN